MYLLIEFDDDQDARDEVIYWQVDATIGSVVGIYRKPTQFCDCNVARKPPLGWSRGPKYHWWICTLCGRPSKQWANALPECLGRNLLEQSSPEPQTPEENPELGVKGDN